MPDRASKRGHGRSRVAAVVYRGTLRVTEVAVRLRRITPEIAQIDCIECGGTGQFHGHPEIEALPCVECKGTGVTHVAC